MRIRDWLTLTLHGETMTRLPDKYPQIERPIIELKHTLF